MRFHKMQRAGHTALLAALLVAGLAAGSAAQEPADDPDATDASDAPDASEASEAADASESGATGSDARQGEPVEAEATSAAEPTSDGAGTDPEQAPEKPTVASLEEITVTAQKRAENIQDVPISVTALNEQFLQDSGITEFNDLQQFVPNLRINPVTDSRSTVIRIRGIGSIGDNAGVDPSVGVFIDGVYQGRPGMSISDLMDIETVQVLRGPQGTLYGKNTAAGAIVVTTRRPVYDFESTLETVLGSYNRLEFRGSVNVPIMEDKVATRLSGFKVKRDGYDTNTFDGRDVNDNDKFGIRSKTLIDFTPEISLLISGDYTNQDDRCCVADIKTYQGPPALFVTFADMAVNRGDDPQELIDSANQFDRVVGADASPRNEVQVWGAAAELDWAPDEHTVKWLNAYRGYTSDSQFDGDFSVFNAVLAFTDTTLHQFSTELSYTSPAYDSVEYQGGLYFYYQTQDTLERNGYEQEWADEFGPAMGVPEFNIGDNTHQTFSYAAYGHGTWNLADQWALQGGLRITHEKKTRVGTQTSTNTALPPPIGGSDVFKDEGRAVTNLSGRITLQYYPPVDDVMIYGSFANGFKSGGFNQLRTDEGVPSEFGDESSLTGEIGVRTTWLDRKITFNLTGFYTSYDDYQVRTFDGVSINIRNAAALQSYGIESDLTYIPVPEWILGASLGWNIAEFTDFKTAEQTAEQQLQSGQIPGAPFNPNGRFFCVANPCVQDLSNRTLDNAPEWTISAYTQYENELPWLPIYYYGRADYSFSSRHFLAQDLDPNLKQEGYNLLNLRIGLRAEDLLWDVAFWIRNVTNTKYNVVGFDVPILNGFAVINGPPREFGATIRVKF